MTDNNSEKLKKVATDFEVKTMPPKFLSMRPSSGQATSSVKKLTGTKRTVVIGAVIIIIVGILMVTAAWLFLRSVNKEEETGTITPIVPVISDNSDDKTAPPDTVDTTIEDNSNEEKNQNLLDQGKWDSYTSDKYGYELKYPAVWEQQIVNNPPTPKNCLQFFSVSSKDNDVDFDIYIFENEQSSALKNWLDQNTNYTAKPESFSLHNNPSLKYDYGSGQYSIYSSANGYIYNLSFSQSDVPDINTVYNRMLANFKFIEIEAKNGNMEEPLPQTPDTDSDSLTDVEEDLYGTDKNKPDTDGDTYNDALEVANLYDPNVPGNAKIYESDLVATYIDDKYKYNILYPASWEVKDMDSEIIFQSATGEFIEVLIEPNNQGYLSIKDWYRDQFGDIATKNIEISGLPAIKSGGNLRVYILFGDYIYGLIYNVGLRDNTNFITTFSMMTQSFTLMH